MVYALTVFKCAASSDFVVFRLSAKTKEQTLNLSEVDLIMNWRRYICLYLKMRVIQGKRRKWKHYQYLFGQTKNTNFLLKNNHIARIPLHKKMFNVLQYQRSHVTDSDYDSPVTCLTQSYIFLSDIRENVWESKSK